MGGKEKAAWIGERRNGFEMSRAIVTLEQLEALAADYAPPPEPPRPAPPPMTRASASVVERCRRYLAKVGPSIEGQHGSDRIFQAARIIWNDFGIDEPDGYPLLEEFNRRSQPTWPDEGKQGLRRKWDEAVKKGPGPEGRGFKVHRDRAGWVPQRPSTNGQPDSHNPPPDNPPKTPEGQTARPQPLFRFIDSAEFLAGDYRPRWLIPRILVRSQPGVIAGPSKGMKTSILIDMAVSLATARAFLGTFPVRERVRVAVVSGESGEHTLKETCLRILAAKELDGSALTGWLKWEFTLPTFSDLESMTAFGEALARVEADVVMIDPTYLALGEIDARNLFEMGRALRTIAAVLQKLRPDLTVILVHHANRLLPIGEVMELQHLAYSGLEQYARQFILLNRREAYRNDGEHDVWVRVGGSTGHGGLWSLHISEGTVEEDFSGRKWNVHVSTPEEAQHDAAVAKHTRTRTNAAIEDDLDDQAVLDAIDREFTEYQRPPTREGIREWSKISSQRVTEAVKRLLQRGRIEEVDTVRACGDAGGERTYKGLRRMADDG
jgi:hypothetical protein